MKNEEYVNNTPTDGDNAEGTEILNLFGERVDDEVPAENTECVAEDTTLPSPNGAEAPMTDDAGYATLLTDALDGAEPFDPEIICDDLIGHDDTEEIALEEDADKDETEDEADEYTDEHSQEAEDGDDEGEGEETEETSHEAQEAEPTPKPRRVDSVFDFIEICIFTLAGVFLLMSFFFRYSIVDGGSMMNTLQHQERLLISNFFYTPECGDIVVVQDRSTELKDPIVKRVIAVGGQTVKFTRTDVYVDGVKLDEPYVYTADYTNAFGATDQYRYSVYPSDALLDLVIGYQDGVYYEIRVPEGEIFVMGDHRNNSKDSRDIGTLHEEAIIGKAIYRFFPFDKSGKIE